MVKKIKSTCRLNSSIYILYGFTWRWKKHTRTLWEVTANFCIKLFYYFKIKKKKTWDEACKFDCPLNKMKLLLNMRPSSSQAFVTDPKFNLWWLSVHWSAINMCMEGWTTFLIGRSRFYLSFWPQTRFSTSLFFVTYKQVKTWWLWLWSLPRSRWCVYYSVPLRKKLEKSCLIFCVPSASFKT